MEDERVTSFAVPQLYRSMTEYLAKFLIGLNISVMFSTLLRTLSLLGMGFLIGVLVRSYLKKKNQVTVARHHQGIINVLGMVELFKLRASWSTCSVVSLILSRGRCHLFYRLFKSTILIAISSLICPFFSIYRTPWIHHSAFAPRFLFKSYRNAYEWRKRWKKRRKVSDFLFR